MGSSLLHLDVRKHSFLERVVRPLAQAAQEVVESLSLEVIKSI